MLPRRHLGEWFWSSRENWDKFLAEIERRAFRMAQVALRDPDDALDVVQDAMLKLTRNYAAQPEQRVAPAVLSHSGERHSRPAAAPQRSASV